jgi:CRP-like cAMP-binding protein
MYSLSGKECILAIHCMGDVFGESCLAGTTRIETALAMENTILKQIPSQSILRAIQLRTIQVNDLIRHLVKRNLEQELFIVDLLTLSSEFRLGKTLLLLAYKLGEERPSGIAIPKRIIQEELSQMVGTTRPRVSEFLQKFRQLGLIELSAERFIIIKEENLANYLLRAA